MKKNKIKVHFVDSYLTNPTNPVSINLIGAGGTGSKLLSCLMELNHTLNELGHCGISVRLWDDDIISHTNIGRQRFAESEVGLHKSVALINRINRWSGTNWKAETRQFRWNQKTKQAPDNARADITISCVDNIQSRFEIGEILNHVNDENLVRNSPKYWIDFGNSRYTGQIILATVGVINQPKSKKYSTVDNLPFVTVQYKDLLISSEKKDNTPSCSMAESLTEQSLFINGSLAQLGAKMLEDLFRNGIINYKGLFLNLENFRTQPIPL